MKFIKKEAMKKAILLFILILAAFLRFHDISKVPVSLYWDEVASTYNAYSIAKTGKDEYGTPTPLLFKSFLDYKTPANVYLTAISTQIFGLNEFSARFSSAFLGTLTVLFTFFLVNEMFKEKSLSFSAENVALISSFLLAISPWHIQFSRTGFEANTGLFFVIVAIWLFFRFINTKKLSSYILAMAMFAVSIYFYRSIWVFVPLVTIVLHAAYRRIFIFDYRKEFVLGCIVFLIVLAPFLPSAFSREGFTRQAQVNVFTNSGDKVYESAVKQLNSGNTMISKIQYNRRVVYIQTIAANYLLHFGPNFLFLQGDGNPRHGVSGMGLMYLWELPFLIIGLFCLSKINKKIAIIILAWILIAPIPSALSVPSPHALRSLNILPMPQLLVALGILFIFHRWSKYRKYLLTGIIVLCVAFFARYLHLYYHVTPNLAASSWADGYKQLVAYTATNSSSYDKILVSGHYWQPYIYFLFYTRYDPLSYQKKGSSKGFGKYIFGGTSWDHNGIELGNQNLENLSGSRNTLVALSPLEYSLQMNNLIKISEIKNHNEETVFVLAKIK